MNNSQDQINPETNSINNSQSQQMEEQQQNLSPTQQIQSQTPNQAKNPKNNNISKQNHANNNNNNKKTKTEQQEETAELSSSKNHINNEDELDLGSSVIVNQKCPIHIKKKVQSICFNPYCIKRGRTILCSKCQLENHAQHSHQIIKISKYIDHIQKAKTDLKQDISELNIYKVDNISREKHVVLKQILNTYEKSIFTICDWYNSYLDFEENTQCLISTDRISDFAQSIKLMSQFVKFDQQTQKITPIQSKFKFDKQDELHGDLPADFLTFEQNMFENLQNLHQQLSTILDKHKTLLENSQQQRKEQLEQEQQRQLELEEQQMLKSQSPSQKPKGKKKHSGSEFSDSDIDLENSNELNAEARNLKRKNSYRSLEKNKEKEREKEIEDELSDSDSNDFKNYPNNNQNGPYGFDWATEWVEELPKGWQDMLETKSRTPCIGIIVSKRIKDQNVNMEALQKCIKDNFKVYNCFFKEDICKKDQMEKLCLLINVRTATTIKAAKVLKKIIKSSFKGHEICVKTWGSRKQVNKFHQNDRNHPPEFGYRKHIQGGGGQMGGMGGYHSNNQNRHSSSNSYAPSYKQKTGERSRSRENYNKYSENNNKYYQSSASSRPIGGGEHYKKRPFNAQY